MDLQLIHVEDVFLKLEATEGTDATCAGTDTLQLIKPATIALGAEVLNPRPDLQNQLLDDAQSLPPSAKYYDITMTGQIRGLGSAYSASAFPEMHSLLQAFGFSATFTGGVKWVYDTASTSLKTATIYGFRGTAQGNFVKHILLAARGKSLTLRFPAGQPAEYTAVLRGIWTLPTDVSNLVPTYQTAAPPNFGGAGSWSLGALSTAIVRSASVTIETPLQPRLSGNATDSLAGYQQATRSASFEASFEAGRVSDYDLYTAWKAATGQALAIAIGTGANNKFAVASSTATITDAPTYNEETGLWLYGVKGLLTPEGANRVQLTFGA